MKNKVRRRRFVKAAGAAGIGAFAGCSGDNGNGNNNGSGADGGGDGSGTTTGDPESYAWADLSDSELHFLNSDNSEESQAFWDNVAEAFEEETGATMEVEYIGAGSNHDERVTQLLQAGDPPELDFIQPYLAATLGYEGVLNDISEAVDYASDHMGTPSEHGLVEIEGDTVLFPTANSHNVMWYRTDLPSSPDQPPNSWDEFEQYVKDTHELDSSDGDNIPENGIYLATGQGAHAASHHWSYALTNDCRVVTRNDEDEVVCHIADGDNREKWIETLNWMNTLHDHSPTSTDSSWSTLYNSIQTGQAAATWYSGARPKNYADYNDRPFAEAIDFLPVAMPENRGELTRSGGNGLGGFANSEYPHMTVEFLKWFSEPVDDRPTIRDFPFEFAPMQNILAWPEERQEDYYIERSLEATGPGWTDEQVERFLSTAGEDSLNITDETNPPNPYAGAIWSSNELNDMVATACVDDQDPGSLLDEYQENINSLIEDTRN